MGRVGIWAKAKFSIDEHLLGLKPTLIFAALVVRLKPCRCYKAGL